MRPTAILLLHCPDQPGIISEVTKFITDNQGNIVYLDQYVDRQDSVFFMRIEWELDKFLIPREKIEEYITTLYAQRYQEQFDIPYYVWSVKKDHSNKEEVEAAEMQLLKEKKVTFIVLARYMQIITDKMIEAYPHHIINIHHSFLPAFVGAKPYHQAWERGVKIIGATSHYVTNELDAGPIIEQDVVRITHKEDPDSLVLKGRDLEKIVLSRAVTKHIQRKILTYHNKTIIFS